MDEVFINQEADPYVLDANGTLDVAVLQLQPATVGINGSVVTPTQVADKNWPIGTDLFHGALCSKKGLVDVKTSKTKRTLAELQEKVLRDATAGSITNPLRISGVFLAGKIKQAATCS